MQSLFRPRRHAVPHTTLYSTRMADQKIGEFSFEALCNGQDVLRPKARPKDKELPNVRRNSDKRENRQPVQGQGKDLSVLIVY
jgi:hypothetical protein